MSLDKLLFMMKLMHELNSPWMPNMIPRVQVIDMIEKQFTDDFWKEIHWRDVK